MRWSAKECLDMDVFNDFDSTLSSQVSGINSPNSQTMVRSPNQKAKLKFVSAPYSPKQQNPQKSGSIFNNFIQNSREMQSSVP